MWVIEYVQVEVEERMLLVRKYSFSPSKALRVVAVALKESPAIRTARGRRQRPLSLWLWANGLRNAPFFLETPNAPHPHNSNTPLCPLKSWIYLLFHSQHLDFSTSLTAFPSRRDTSQPHIQLPSTPLCYSNNPILTYEPQQQSWVS